MSTRPNRFESGAMVVMFAMYTLVFVMIIALAVNVYLIGNALMQQRNAVEYVAMSVLKIANEPAVPLNTATCLQDEISYLNCILKRAEVAGKVKVGSLRDSFYVQAGTLKVVPRGSDNACCIPNPNIPHDCDKIGPKPPDDGGGPTGPGDGGGDDDDGRSPGDQGDDDFCWDSYKIENEEHAELVLGKYTAEENGRGRFTDAAKNEVKNGNFNAVKLRFHFNPTNENTKMLAPLIGLFGSNMKLQFSSSALAYRTPAGSIQLAIDPTLSMGN